MSRKPALLALAAVLATRGAFSAEIALTTQASLAGTRQAGGNVQINAALALIGGTLSAGAPTAGAAITLKGGFAGQLVDAQALAFSATGTNVNETASLQLQAAALLDDGSYLNLTGTDVLWSGQSGPIDLITSGGLLLAGAVYQDTPAVVRGEWRGASGSLGLLVKDALPDNFPTSPYNFASDGLPDAWQLAHFAAGSANAAPSADGDGDGLSALAEYVFDTDPTNAASGDAARPAAGFVNAGGVDYLAITFKRRQTFVTSLTYEVQSAGTVDGAWAGGLMLVSSSGPDADGMMTEVWRDTAPVAGSSQRFLRLKLSLNP